MRFLLRLAAAALIAAAALTFSLVASGASKQGVARKEAKIPGSSGPCFPSNQFTVSNHFGPFSASSSGSGDGTVSDSNPEQSASVTWNASESVTGNAGTVAWSQTSGNMSGRLKAQITIAGSPSRLISFMSKGILEANVENDGDGDLLMEAEYCGKVQRSSPFVAGLPCTWETPPNPTCLDATATIELSGDGTEVSNFQISIDIGTACNESSTDEIQVKGGGSGSWASGPTLNSGEQRGRVNFPNGYNNTNCPGFDDD